MPCYVRLWSQAGPQDTITEMLLYCSIMCQRDRQGCLAYSWQAIECCPRDTTTVTKPLLYSTEFFVAPYQRYRWFKRNRRIINHPIRNNGLGRTVHCRGDPCGRPLNNICHPTLHGRPLYNIFRLTSRCYSLPHIPRLTLHTCAKIQFLFTLPEEGAEFAAKVGIGPGDTAFPAADIDIRRSDEASNFLLRPLSFSACLGKSPPRWRCGLWYLHPHSLLREKMIEMLSKIITYVLSHV